MSLLKAHTRRCYETNENFYCIRPSTTKTGAKVETFILDSNYRVFLLFFENVPFSGAFWTVGFNNNALRFV